MTPQLEAADYSRMIFATVPCHACGVPRGVQCRNQNNGNAWALTSRHGDRTTAFAMWRKRNPGKYQRLRDQLLRLKFEDTDLSYETQPA